MESITIIGPGRSKAKYDISKLQNKVIFNFSGDLVWFCENDIYPTYWSFFDPNSVVQLLDKIQNHTNKPEWIEGLKTHTSIIFHNFQGTDDFYRNKFTTSRGLEWNREVFGKNILPLACSFFKDTIKLPQIICPNNYDLFYNSELDGAPILAPENRVHMDKFMCYVIPTVLYYFKELKYIECIGWGDFDEPRLEGSKSRGGYEAYKASYNMVKDKLIKLLQYKKIEVGFNNKSSYFIELENSTKQ